MAQVPGLYPHTVTIEEVTARDQRGKPTTFGTAQAPRASVIPKPEVLYGGSDEEVVSRGRAICEGPLTVAEDSVITFPSEFGFASRLRVLRAIPSTDPLTGAIDNVEVYV